jgi:hypothetical protein
MRCPKNFLFIRQSAPAKRCSASEAFKAVYSRANVRDANLLRIVMSSHDALLDTLKAVRHYLQQREDVNDGNDGRQVPNEAMSLLMELGPQIDAAIQKAEQ